MGQRVLKFDGLSGRGLRIALRTMSMKSALRDWLSESDGMISITMMSHLRWLSPLWCLTAPPSRPAGKRVTRFSGRFAPLRIVFPCHRGIGRATKGKRLYGQARRLTSPDLHILCRMCTVDNKAPQSNPFTQRIAKNKVPPPGGKWWRQPPKGVHFPRPQGGCMVFIKGAFYNLEAPTTTLSGEAAVKLKNPRGDSPVKL